MTTNKKVKITLGLGIILCYLWIAVDIIHDKWVYNKNIHAPCVPYKPGMTLAPGQCTVMHQTFTVPVPARSKI